MNSLHREIGIACFPIASKGDLNSRLIRFLVYPSLRNPSDLYIIRTVDNHLWRCNGHHWGRHRSDTCESNYEEYLKALGRIHVWQSDGWFLLLPIECYRSLTANNPIRDMAISRNHPTATTKNPGVVVEI